MTELISRNDAADKGRRTFFTGMPCRAGHVSERYTSNGTCLQCLQRFRRTAVNPWTKQLVPFIPQGLFSPAGLTPELHAELMEFMHQSVAHWVNHKGLMTDSIQNAYTEAQRHRLQRASVKP